MQAATKKPRIEEEMITLRLRVHRSNAPRIREYAEIIEADTGKRRVWISRAIPTLRKSRNLNS